MTGAASGIGRATVTSLLARGAAVVGLDLDPIVETLLERDEYLLLADYESYIACQERVSAAYLDRKRWTRMSILNVARMGKFSSDRAIREYCRDIWHIRPVPVRLLSEAEVKVGFLQ